MRVLAVVSLLLLTSCGTVGNALIIASVGAITAAMVENDR